MMLNSKSIGNKIAEARKKSNLSQSELAQQVSISPQAVGKWERGESMPDIMTLNRLAEIFGVDLNYFSENFKSSEKEIAGKVNTAEDGLFTKLKDNLGLNWNMSGENYVEADFSGIKNVNDKLSGSSFKKCKLIEADLSEITFKGNSIRDCDFLNTGLRNSKFDGSEIKTNSFVNASFIDAIIVSSEIRNCDFSNANLSGIEISNSEFRNNKIENTKWHHASFKSTQFTEIIFSGLLEECSFTSCAFTKVSFKNATLKNSFFKYSNLKNVAFIDCQADKLTYEFLKNCKANLTGINLL
ncbi:MAG: pentapeptide repeat-containing protein [Bacteroidota bacterium]